MENDLKKRHIAPETEVYRKFLQDFGMMRGQWEEQRQWQGRFSERIIKMLTEKDETAACEKIVQEMWEQAQGHLGELSGRLTLLEQKKTVADLGELSQQVEDLRRDFTKLHGAVDGQADILQNIDSRMERLEGQIQQEGVPEL